MNEALSILLLVVLEGLLSFDNALAIAALIRHLPTRQRGRALAYGIWGAMGFRVLAMVFLIPLLKHDWVRLSAAGYLLWLAVSFWVGTKKEQAQGGLIVSHASFWRTVLLVEVTDVACSIDSIVASVAVSDRLWIVLTGGLIGIVMMRFFSSLFVRLIDRYPRLEAVAFMLIAWVGVKMVWSVYSHDVSPIANLFFWCGTLTCLSWGFSKKTAYAKVHGK